MFLCRSLVQLDQDYGRDSLDGERKRKMDLSVDFAKL